MPRHALVRDADGVVLAHGFCDFTAGPGESVVVVPEDFIVDRRTERYDAASPTRRRPATPEELASHAAAEADAEAAQQQAARAIKATVVWTLRRLLGRTPTAEEIRQARDEWVAVWKVLG